MAIGGNDYSEAKGEVDAMKLPQLSLRELFLIVVIAAVGCGWWVNRAGLRQQLREANEKFEDASKQMMRRLTYR